MAITSLKDAFPRMSIIEKQSRALKTVAFGMMPLLLQALDAKEHSPRTEKA